MTTPERESETPISDCTQTGAPIIIRLIAMDLHPIETDNYRVATPAIEVFHDLILWCLEDRRNYAYAIDRDKPGTRNEVFPRPACGLCRFFNKSCRVNSSLLQTRYPHCDKEMAYHFRARVLDTPFCCGPALQFPHGVL